MDHSFPLKHPAPSSEDFSALKRPKFDANTTLYPPSRVLFVRGLPQSVTGKALVNVFSELGVLQNLFILHSKGQAFVEFDSIEAANQCLFHCSLNPIYLHGSVLLLSYSGRQHITETPNLDSQPSPELVLNISSCKYPVTTEVLNKILSPYGPVISSRIFQRDTAFQVVLTFNSLESAISAKEGLSNKHIYDGSNFIQTGFSPMPQLAHAHPEQAREETSKVVFLHNLGEGATPDLLFNLFSLYGNVMSIKIFQKRSDMALVEYEDSKQALTAKNYLGNLPFLRKLLLVSISRNTFISVPTNPRAEYYKDFSKSSFHRYKVAGSKNFRNMFPPSCVLHLSNTPEDLGQADFKELFKRDAEIVAFKRIGEDHRMALVKFNTLEDAVEVLVRNHNISINGSYLKVAFSKASM